MTMRLITRASFFLTIFSRVHSFPLPLPRSIPPSTGMPPKRKRKASRSPVATRTKPRPNHGDLLACAAWFRDTPYWIELLNREMTRGVIRILPGQFNSKLPPWPQTKERWFLAQLHGAAMRSDFLKVCGRFMKEEREAKEREEARVGPFLAERKDFIEWCTTQKFGKHRFTYSGKIGVDPFVVTIESTPIPILASGSRFRHGGDAIDSRLEPGSAPSMRLRNDGDCFRLINLNYAGHRSLGIELCSSTRYHPMNHYDFRSAINPKGIVQLTVISSRTQNCLSESVPPFEPHKRYGNARNNATREGLIRSLPIVLIPIVCAYACAW